MRLDFKAHIFPVFPDIILHHLMAGHFVEVCVHDLLILEKFVIVGNVVDVFEALAERRHADAFQDVSDIFLVFVEREQFGKFPCRDDLLPFFPLVL